MTDHELAIIARQTPATDLLEWNGLHAEAETLRAAPGRAGLLERAVVALEGVVRNAMALTGGSLNETHRAEAAIIAEHRGETTDAALARLGPARGRVRTVNFEDSVGNRRSYPIERDPGPVPSPTTPDPQAIVDLARSIDLDAWVDQHDGHPSLSEKVSSEEWHDGDEAVMERWGQVRELLAGVGLRLVDVETDHDSFGGRLERVEGGPA